jgi:hypothetical protein
MPTPITAYENEERKTPSHKWLTAMGFMDQKVGNLDP